MESNGVRSGNEGAYDWRTAAAAAIVTGALVFLLLVEVPTLVREFGLAMLAAIGVVVYYRLLIEIIREIRRPRPPTPPPPEPWKVFKNRDEAAQEIVNALVKQVQMDSGDMITCGVALRELLQYGRWKHDGKDLPTLLAEGLGKSTNRVNWDIMLLDPDCPEADRRAKLEGTGATIGDIRSAIERYRERFERHNDRVRLFLYKRRPFLFAVVTQEVAFEQRYLDVPPPDSGPGCFGNLTPVLKYSARAKDSKRYYDQLRAELMAIRDASEKQNSPPSYQ